MYVFQPYLPQIYVESDSDATSCYLFFCRLGYKADLINSVVAQTHNLPDSLNGDVSETLVGVCEVSNHTELFYFPCKKNNCLFHRCGVEFLACLCYASGLQLSFGVVTLKRFWIWAAFTLKLPLLKSGSTCTSTFFDGMSLKSWSAWAILSSKFIFSTWYFTSFFNMFL